MGKEKTVLPEDDLRQPMLTLPAMIFGIFVLIDLALGIALMLRPGLILLLVLLATILVTLAYGALTRNLEAAKYHVFELAGKRFALGPGFQFFNPAAHFRFTLPMTDDRPKEGIKPIPVQLAGGESGIATLTIGKWRFPGVEAVRVLLETVGDPDDRYAIAIEAIRSATESACQSVSVEDLLDKTRWATKKREVLREINANLSDMLQDENDRLWQEVIIGNIVIKAEVLKKTSVRKEEGAGEADFYAAMRKRLIDEGIPPEEAERIVRDTVRWRSIGGAVEELAGPLLNLGGLKRGSGKGHGKEPDGREG